MAFPTSWLTVSGTTHFSSGAVFASNGSLTVAITDHIYSATDSDTWTLRQSIVAGNSKALAYSPSLGLFFAAAGNQYYTSPDGITWTSRATNPPNTLRDVAWSPALGLFIGVGTETATNNGVILTSADGITWTVRRNTAGFYITIAWSASLGKAVVNIFSGGLCQILTSTDGINWTQTSPGFPTADYLTGVVWSPETGLFVSAYSATDQTTFAVTRGIRRSTDGINWTTCTLPETLTNIGVISWLPGVNYFVASCKNFDDSVAYFVYSSDGVTWELSTIPSNRNYATTGKLVYISPYIFVPTSTDNFSSYRGLSVVSLNVAPPPLDLPFTVGGAFLDAPSNLYGFAGTLHGTIGAYVTLAGELYGFSGNVVGMATEGVDTGGDLYGFAGVLDGYGGDSAELYGFAGTVDGNIMVLGDAVGNLYGFAGVVDAQARAIEYASGNLYGFAGVVDSHENGSIGQLYGFAGTVDGVILAVTPEGVNVDVNEAATVMNAHTQAVTRYLHYQFKHLTVIGGRLYGVRSDGLYALAGTADVLNAVSTPVNGRIMTKETDFGSYESSRCPYVYVNGDSQLKVTPYCDGVEKLPHLTSFKGRKTHLARGNAARYWRFKVEQIQQLEGLEPLPEKRQRRVK